VGANGPSATFTSDVSVGSLIVVAAADFASVDGIGVTDSAGNVYIKDQENDASNGYINTFWHTVAKTAAALVVSFTGGTGGFPQCDLWELSNTSFDAFGSGSASAVDSATSVYFASPDITVNAPGISFGIIASYNGISGSVTGGWVQDYGAPAAGSWWAGHQSVVSGDTLSIGTTQSGPGNASVVVYAASAQVLRLAQTAALAVSITLVAAQSASPHPTATLDVGVALTAATPSLRLAQTAALALSITLGALQEGALHQTAALDLGAALGAGTPGLRLAQSASLSSAVALATGNPTLGVATSANLGLSASLAPAAPQLHSPQTAGLSLGATLGATPALRYQASPAALSLSTVLEAGSGTNRASSASLDLSVALEAQGTLHLASSAAVTLTAALGATAPSFRHVGSAELVAGVALVAASPALTYRGVGHLGVGVQLGATPVLRSADSIALTVISAALAAGAPFLLYRATAALSAGVSLVAVGTPVVNEEASLGAELVLTAAEPSLPLILLPAPNTQGRSGVLAAPRRSGVLTAPRRSGVWVPA